MYMTKRKDGGKLLHHYNCTVNSFNIDHTNDVYREIYTSHRYIFDEANLATTVIFGLFETSIQFRFDNILQERFLKKYVKDEFSITIKLEE